MKVTEKNPKPEEQPEAQAAEQAASQPDPEPVNVPAAAKIPGKPTPRIYVGPNLRNGRLIRYTVFRDGIPLYLQDMVEQHPNVANLTVPINEMESVLKKIEEAGTPEYVWFQSLKGVQL